MQPIVVEDLWLKFRVQFRDSRMTTQRFLMQSAARIAGNLRHGRGWSAGASSDFWALRGISFTIEKGEVVGIIGANGAGKSTLLMVLAKIYAPNQGTVCTQGRIGTLLSLGAGFNNELTGRENIALSGICMGLSRKEMRQEERGIIDLADLGEFIDAPLKTYSNGMRARLGFAIAVNIDPDILLIDEVLQAGDIAFRRKSGNILHNFQDQNKTIVVVTHDMPLVQKACNRAMLLDKGGVALDGDPGEVIEQYTKIQNQET